MLCYVKELILFYFPIEVPQFNILGERLTLGCYFDLCFGLLSC